MTSFKSTSISAAREELVFVQKAAEAFKTNPAWATYGDLGPGQLLALRWGLDNNCVMVVKIAEDSIPVNYVP